MTKADATSTVEEWLAVIKIATDPDSPFKGMVDLTEIFKVPLATQWEIFNRLSADEKAQLQSLYGKKKGDGE